jgi:hypothetical protein
MFGFDVGGGEGEQEGGVEGEGRLTRDQTMRDETQIEQQQNSNFV